MTVDAGSSWRSIALPIEPARAISLDEAFGVVGVERSRGVQQWWEVLPDGQIGWLSSSPSPPPSARPAASLPDAAVPGPLGSGALRAAIEDGWPLTDGTALVARDGALARVRLDDGALVELVPDAFQLKPARCHPLSLSNPGAPGAFGFVCGESRGVTALFRWDERLARLVELRQFESPREVHRVGQRKRRGPWDMRASARGRLVRAGSGVVHHDAQRRLERNALPRGWRRSGATRGPLERPRCARPSTRSGGSLDGSPDRDRWCHGRRTRDACTAPHRTIAAGYRARAAPGRLDGWLRRAPPRRAFRLGRRRRVYPWSRDCPRRGGAHGRVHPRRRSARCIGAVGPRVDLLRRGLRDDRRRHELEQGNRVARAHRRAQSRPIARLRTHRMHRCRMDAPRLGPARGADRVRAAPRPHPSGSPAAQPDVVVRTSGRTSLRESKLAARHLVPPAGPSTVVAPPLPGRWRRLFRLGRRAPRRVSPLRGPRRARDPKRGGRGCRPRLRTRSTAAFGRPRSPAPMLGAPPRASGTPRAGGRYAGNGRGAGGPTPDRRPLARRRGRRSRTPAGRSAERAHPRSGRCSRATMRTTRCSSRAGPAPA